jgi:hypothetical protein
MKSLNFSGSVPLPPSAQATLSPSLLATLQGEGPERNTPKSFHSSHIYIWMLESVSLAFIIYFPGGISFSFGTLLEYFVYLVLIVIIFTGLINHNSIGHNQPRTASLPRRAGGMKM